MKKTGNRFGFLLVEILVALSVVALSLGVLLQVFSHAFQNAVSAKRYQMAALLAEQKLWDSLWDEKLSQVTTSGQFEEEPGMSWETTITLLYHPIEEEESSTAKAGGTAGREKLPETDLYQIEVKVFWMEGGKSRQFDLATYTTVPVPQLEEQG